ncbi:MAG: class II fructose-bisphosphate aldolase family protein, partial [Cyclobacteriaceae bacterium]|nr:class II fructose-bisphosphate aldolase family protein [Cyclobacteriaceae bacterium]
MKLQDKLHEVRQQKKALLATNFYNFETLKGLMEAARATQLPVILQLTKSSINYMGLENAVAMARSAIEYYKVESWIHLDHGDTVELAAQCLKAGFDSVMIDASELPFEENVKMTREVVKIAGNYGVNVEAELGYVAKLGQSTDLIGYTEPEDVKTFVETTGVNALAIAIGTAHGFYKKEPKLDLERLEKINRVSAACLVLHGGSGVPDDQIRKAVRLGICKVNVATEIKNIFMQQIKRLMRETDEIDLRKVFPPATEAVKNLVINKLNLVSSIDANIMNNR